MNAGDQLRAADGIIVAVELCAPFWALAWLFGRLAGWW
jgi:hypothetical protein